MSKVVGIFVKFWHFAIPAHQIWLCPVTQEANFEKYLLFLVLHFILGDVTKFLVEKLSTSEVISQKMSWGETHPSPSAFDFSFISSVEKLHELIP